MDDLYQREILRLAAEAQGAGRLQPADASATVDNPFCGDRITMDVRITAGRITAIGHEAKACALCQASASAIGHNALGKAQGEIEAAMQSIADYLKSQDKADPAWPEFAAFAPAKSHSSRHRCVLLPFEALILAMGKTAA